MAKKRPNVYDLRNDAKKIFGRTTYDRKNPIQFTFTLNQLKKLVSWANPAGKSKEYLRSPFIPAAFNQASFKSQSQRKLIEFLNGELAQNIPANKKIDIRYLMDMKTIQAFESLVLWSGYYKVGQYPTKKDLTQVLGQFIALKDKWPPVDLSNEASMRNRDNIDKLIALAQTELNNGSKDNNTGIINYPMYDNLQQEVKRLSNINLLKGEWLAYQQQAAIEKQNAEIRKKNRAKKNKKEAEAEKEADKQEAKSLEEMTKAREAREGELNVTVTADSQAHMEEQEAEFAKRSVEINKPIHYHPGEDVTVEFNSPAHKK